MVNNPDKTNRTVAGDYHCHLRIGNVAAECVLTVNDPNLTSDPLADWERETEGRHIADAFLGRWNGCRVLDRGSFETELTLFDLGSDTFEVTGTEAGRRRCALRMEIIAPSPTDDFINVQFGMNGYYGEGTANVNAPGGLRSALSDVFAGWSRIRAKLLVAQDAGQSDFRIACEIENGPEIKVLVHRVTGQD